jgi:hypothetical protein
MKVRNLRAEKRIVYYYYYLIRPRGAEHLTDSFSISARSEASEARSGFQTFRNARIFGIVKFLRNDARLLYIQETRILI